MKIQISISYCLNLIFIFLFFHLAFVPVSAHAMTYKWIKEQDISPFQRSVYRAQTITEANHDTHTSPNEPFKKNPGKYEDPLEKDIDEALNNLGKAIAKGIKDILIIAGRKLENAGAGFGDWLEVAARNLPDIQLEEYRNKNEEFRQGVKNLLVGAFLMCQFQFMVEGATACSKEGLNISEEMVKEYEDYIVFINPDKNSPKDLLISAYHKQIGDVWEITHMGKQSLKEVKRNIKKGI